MSPAVVMASLLLGVLGVTHLARPGVWRSAVGAWARAGGPGVVLYGVLHALPGIVLVAISVPPERPAEWLAHGLGWVLTAKGTWLMLGAERAAPYLLRMAERRIAHWRVPGAVGAASSASLLIGTGGGLL